jgi:PleD family two-component response regulator
VNTTIEAPSVILTALAKDSAFSGVLARTEHAVVEVDSGQLAVRWAHEVQPDAIILAARLPDMAGLEVCQVLRDDPQVGRNVPILILTTEEPSPDQRVAALRVGAWDFLCPADDDEELTLRLRTYVQAKRNIDAARAEGLIDPATGLHSRHALAHRARELGALMVRKNGALACVVIALDGEPALRQVTGALLRTARVSDVVGSMGFYELGVLAPATDHVGAVRFMRRLVAELNRTSAAQGRASTPVLRVGFDAITNMRYAPSDPVELLARASAAVRSGRPETEHPWLRRFDMAWASGFGDPGAQRVSPVGLTLGNAGSST